MMEFYGIELGVFSNRNFWHKDLQWLTPHNHNFLRITRILTSLKLFRNDRQAKKLLSALIYNQNTIKGLQHAYWMNRNGGSYATCGQLFPEDTMNFWTDAVLLTNPDVEIQKMNCRR